MIVVKQVCDICKKEIEGTHYEVYLNTDSKDFVDTDVVSENYDFCPDCMAKLLKPYEDILEDEPELKIYIPRRQAAGYVKMAGARKDIPQQKEIPPMPEQLPFNVTCSTSSEFDVTCYSESDEGGDTVPVEGSITGGSDENKTGSDTSDNENVTYDNESVTSDNTEEEDNTAQEITDSLFSDEKFVQGLVNNSSKGYPAKKKRGRPKKI